MGEYYGGALVVLLGESVLVVAAEAETFHVEQPVPWWHLLGPGVP